MAALTRFQIVLFIIFASFTYWINAQDISGGYEWTTDIPDSNKTVHWFNCTINGTIYYDEDCFGWLGRFVLWLGAFFMIVLILFCCCFWYCVCALCKICCCSERPTDVIYATYVYPASSSSSSSNPYQQIA